MNTRSVGMINAGGGRAEEPQVIPLTTGLVYFKTACDFTGKKDMADFITAQMADSGYPLAPGLP